jgi:hypothetical protein
MLQLMDWIYFSQSKQASAFLFIQKSLPHTLHLVFRSKAFLSFATCWYIAFFEGKLMALLWQRDAHAEQ